MIPATSIAFQDDGTAWLIVADDPDQYGWAAALDRPCDSCGGEHSRMASSTAGGHYADGRYHKHFGIGGQMLTQVTCPDCIDGRHTFDIDVECEVVDSWTTTRLDNTQVKHWDGKFKKEVRSLRVSVVPGMVLAIVHASHADGIHGPHICIQPGATFTLHTSDGWQRITLPSDAKPGGFAVQLRVTT